MRSLLTRINLIPGSLSASQSRHSCTPYGLHPGSGSKGDRMNDITENTATTPRSDLYPEGVEANSPIGMVWLALRLHGFENLEVFNKGVIAW